MSSRGLAALGVALVASAGTALWIWQLRPDPKEAFDNRPNTRRTKPLAWGIYQIYWGPGYCRKVRTEVKKFTRGPDYIMFYRDLTRPFPDHPIRCVRAVGAVPIVSLELWTWMGDRKRSYLPRINAGEYDRFFTDWARSAARDGGRLILRFGFEFNGDWFSWSGDPAAFIEAWRRVRAIFHREGALQVEWAWTPNVVSAPRTPQNAPHHYYPGDAHVEWVGLDGYNFGDYHDRWHRWESFESIFRRPLAELQRRYPKKPILIAEFGSAPGRRRPHWIRNAWKHLQYYPNVKAAIWFHYDKRSEGELDWRIDVTPASLRAFNQTFARAR